MLAAVRSNAWLGIRELRLTDESPKHLFNRAKHRAPDGSCDRDDCKDVYPAHHGAKRPSPLQNAIASITPGAGVWNWSWEVPCMTRMPTAFAYATEAFCISSLLVQRWIRVPEAAVAASCPSGKLPLASCALIGLGAHGCLTVAFSGGRRAKRGRHRKQAKRACGRPLERGVRPHFQKRHHGLDSPCFHFM
jgi:hypothetical protein